VAFHIKFWDIPYCFCAKRHCYAPLMCTLGFWNYGLNFILWEVRKNIFFEKKWQQVAVGPIRKYYINLKFYMFYACTVHS